MLTKRLVGALALALGTFSFADGSMAATVNTTSNVVFIVDESGSMGGEQDFLANTVIDQLDQGLSDAGVTSRSYGVVGYGGPNSGTPRLVQSGGGLENAATTKTNLQSLVTSGGFEDGFAAIDFALNNLSFTAGAAINFILVTDEDRDVTSGLGLTVQSIQNSLTSANILLNAVVSNSFSSDNSLSALGIDSDGTAYVANGSGGFNEDTGGTAGGGFGTTTADYVDLAIATGGAAWDLNQLRAGGNPATSFANAFIDIKVQEIISQPPSGPNPIPLPAGMPLLLAGLGVFGFMRRRASAA